MIAFNRNEALPQNEIIYNVKILDEPHTCMFVYRLLTCGLILTSNGTVCAIKGLIF
jgi:hypothetical protein